MRDLIIRNSEWLRGQMGDQNAVLYDTVLNRFCCLGLDLRERGVDPVFFQECATPLTVASMPQVPEDYKADWLIEDRTHVTSKCSEAMMFNDKMALSDAERIERLQPIFAAKGINLIWRPDE